MRPLPPSNSGAAGSASQSPLATFESLPLIDMLYQQFASYVFGTAQRLIDLKVMTGQERASDEAVIASAPRVFADAYAAYEAARSGMVLQSMVLIRSAFEVATQAGC